MVHRDAKYEVDKISQAERLHPEVQENPSFSKKVNYEIYIL